MASADKSTVFQGYAGFYDALYADKDYGAECADLERILSENGVGASASILDLGCGTGGHAVPLALAGHAVTGVDRSPEMLAIAQRKAEAADAHPVLVVGDVRDLDVQRTFDVVISMFAVIGYQLSNDDLAAMLATARRHLAPGGLFVFDAWFGPAVLAEKPEVRRKSVAMPNGSTFVRVATPTLDVVAQTVRVDYSIVRDAAAAEPPPVEESHTMRFLFAQEVAYFLQIAGFEVISLAPFMGGREAPTERDWNVTWVARAI